MWKVAIISLFSQNTEKDFYLTIKPVEFCLLIDVSLSFMQSVLIYPHEKREILCFLFSKIFNHHLLSKIKVNRC